MGPSQRGDLLRLGRLHAAHVGPRLRRRPGQGGQGEEEEGRLPPHAVTAAPLAAGEEKHVMEGVHTKKITDLQLSYDKTLLCTSCTDQATAAAAE